MDDEVGEIGSELYWKVRSKRQFGVTKKIAHKSWRITYKAHKKVKRQFNPLIKRIFRSFTKYKGDYYEDDPSIYADWKFYQTIVTNGKLRRLCDLASLQTKFVKQRCRRCLADIMNTYPSYIKDDYCRNNAEDYKATTELVLALSPILKRGSCLTRASQFIALMRIEPNSSNTIEDWAVANEDIVPFGLTQARSLYQLLQDDLMIVDISGPFPTEHTFITGATGLLKAHQQLWFFIITPFPINM